MRNTDFDRLKRGEASRIIVGSEACRESGFALSGYFFGTREADKARCQTPSEELNPPRASMLSRNTTMHLPSRHAPSQHWAQSTNPSRARPLD